MLQLSCVVLCACARDGGDLIADPSQAERALIGEVCAHTPARLLNTAGRKYVLVSVLNIVDMLLFPLKLALLKLGWK